ncbi:MAG: TonB-dependent receptor [Flavobacteriaceae bacterium]|nr:TonB-dependent receptor [Flavobacteriaceae bacterium]
MNRIFITFILALFAYTTLYAQQDSIIKLETVTLSDVRLKNAADKTIIVKISDSILQNQNGSLTDLLRQHSTLYFKEYGLGMLSSVSFRGTNSSQTAVIWNGININSQTTGQTDFNNVGLGGFNDISVKSGGGSALYGSGAIGGSVHLQHKIDFKKQQTFNLSSTIGSYENYIQSGAFTIANEKSYFNGYVRHQAAENDYPFLETDLKNDNGEIENFSIGYNTAHKLGKRDVLKAYFSYFTNKRNSSRTISVPTKSRLDDKNRRFMLAWNRKATKTNYNIRLANLEEEFKYYENKRKKHLFSGSEVSTIIANADVDYKFSHKLKVKGAIDANLVEAEGDNIDKNIRRSIAGILSVNHKPFKGFAYNLTARKEATNTYKIPFIGSFDLNYKPLKWYKVGVNGSKNFRIPTFNDLYWEGLGNPNLLPETSYQASFNQFFTYKKSSLQLAAFYIDTKDMIKWTPDESGEWHPQNFVNVKNQGIEATLQTELRYKKHRVHISGTYVYVKAIDQETDKQLIYVPLHKFNGNISYHFKKVTAFYENVFTDAVFTDGNNSTSLLSYSVSNAGISCNIALGENTFTLSGKVNNIFNKKYEVVISRPMPNRNFLISIHYKYN